MSCAYFLCLRLLFPPQQSYVCCISIDIHNNVLFIFFVLQQILNADILGRVSDFSAVPGCGLKCQVSNIESVLNSDITDLDIMNRRNSTASSKVTFRFADGLPSSNNTLGALTIEGKQTVWIVNSCTCIIYHMLLCKGIFLICTWSFKNYRQHKINCDFRQVIFVSVEMAKGLMFLLEVLNNNVFMFRIS